MLVTVRTSLLSLFHNMLERGQNRNPTTPDLFLAKSVSTGTAQGHDYVLDADRSSLHLDYVELRLQCCTPRSSMTTGYINTYS